jgi:hypothetical protein
MFHELTDGSIVCRVLRAPFFVYRYYLCFFGLLLFIILNTSTIKSLLYFINSSKSCILSIIFLFTLYLLLFFIILGVIVFVFVISNIIKTVKITRLIKQIDLLKH